MNTYSFLVLLFSLFTGQQDKLHSGIRPVIGVETTAADQVKKGHRERDDTRFEENLIADGFGYSFAVTAGDLDGDGDLDLTSPDTLSSRNIKDAHKNPSNLYWFENNGVGNFTRHFIQRAEIGWLERHAIGDVDGDGNLDVVAVKNLSGAMVWFRNNGQPRDGKRWERHVITTELPGAYDVVLADLDGDGDLDAAASAWGQNYFAWLENPGDPAARGEWTKHIVDDRIAETRMIRVADFNADGKPDLLGSARRGNLVAWYEKTGDSWQRHMIDDVSRQPMHGDAVDMDGDGDPDVVVAVLDRDGQKDMHQVAWYENAGNGGSWKKHIIHELPSGFEAVAGDLDGDGDIDVAATAWRTGRVVWFRNPGHSIGKWTEHVLKENWRGANQIILADLNGDQRLDIAATAEGHANELRWWPN